MLAFVSKPTFDPNLFVDGIDSESWKELNESIDKPLLNRALRGTYPPGSTYKPFMALAALETGKRTPQRAIYDPATSISAATVPRPQGRRPRHGRHVPLHRAVEQHLLLLLANDMGVDLMHDSMKPLRLRPAHRHRHRGRMRGVLPSTDWKRNAYRKPEQQKWYAGETISLGIGQGYNSFTMLQLAQATAHVANNGVKHKPHLVQEVDGHRHAGGDAGRAAAAVGAAAAQARERRGRSATPWSA